MSANPAATTIHSAFYKFVPLSEPPAMVELLKAHTTDLLGSILLAHEGINGMVAGSPEAVSRFEEAIRTAPEFAGAFATITFKRSPCKTDPFGRMKVYTKPEIVPLGIAGVDATKTGIDVPPAQWRELIAKDDVVLLDNRNSFEYRLGRFKGAIDPGVTNFRDFPNYVREHVDEWKRDGKRVAMYCTGGIRCEKTSAWMLDMGVPVYQLEGGILNYFAALPDAQREWEGECFVFDNRVALDTTLNETETTLDQVYSAEPDGEWRLRRARGLESASEK